MHACVRRGRTCSCTRDVLAYAERVNIHVNRRITFTRAQRAIVFSLQSTHRNRYGQAPQSEIIIMMVEKKEVYFHTICEWACEMAVGCMCIVYAVAVRALLSAFQQMCQCMLVFSLLHTHFSTPSSPSDSPATRVYGGVCIHLYLSNDLDCCSGANHYRVFNYTSAPQFDHHNYTRVGTCAHESEFSE